MTGQEKASVGSTLLSVWSRWCSLVEWSRSVGGRLAGWCGGRPAGLSPATRDRVIELIEGDLDCLIEDANEKPIAEQSVEEMLLNREVLVWLRGGPLPGQGAVDLLEENVAVFYRAPAEDEQANGKALRAALDELVRAQAAAQAAGSCEGDGGSAGLMQRERRCFGKRLDELRAGRNMTIGELSARSGIDVVSIVALIHGADEAGALEVMSLAAALEALPRDLFPECLAGPEDEEGRGSSGGPAGREGRDA
jgi:hypothetical protein